MANRGVSGDFASLRLSLLAILRFVAVNSGRIVSKNPVNWLRYQSNRGSFVVLLWQTTLISKKGCDYLAKSSTSF